MEEESDKTYKSLGSSVKDLGNGRIGGYAVIFSDEESTDLEGDFFDQDTYFGSAKTTAIYYHHAQDPVIKKKVLDEEAKLKKDDVGIWVEAQLDLRDKYAAAVYEMVKRGVLGLSTGTAPHLVERVPVGNGKYRIKSWPLGLDTSLTPTPAEPRTLAEVLKSIAIELEDDGNQTQEDESGIKPEEGGKKGDIKMSEKEAKKEEGTELEDAMKAIDERFKQWEKTVDTILEKAASVVTNDPGSTTGKKSGPAFNQKTGLGDNEVKAYAHFVRTGDDSGIKASNDTDMNIGTAADGGNAVPTGHHNEIIAKRDEMALHKKLGVRPIPGTGTTVDVPVDNEADGEFISTNEAAAFDRDAPALDKVQMTLVKYTKKIELSLELLQDEDSRLMQFLSDFVGRGIAKTMNNLLVTEVAANGTQFKEFASATAIAAGEIQDIVYNNDLEPYLDDSSVAWVTRPSTFGDIVSIQGNDFIYDRTPQGDGRGRTLAGLPVAFSQKVAAPAASAKSILFGNWYYVGMREAPGLTVLRDPYSKAANGQVVLHYYFRTVFKVLQAEAVGYGQQATA